MSDQALIDAYEAGGPLLRQAIAGLTPEQLKAAPVPGKWSTHQVVVHLADAEIVLAHRLRRILAEEKPHYNAWDENEFAKDLFYHDQSAEDAVAIVELTRRQFARVLRKMPAGALDRRGVHSAAGEQVGRAVLEMANNHLLHHLKFIKEKREALAKP